MNLRRLAFALAVIPVIALAAAPATAMAATDPSRLAGGQVVFGGDVNVPAGETDNGDVVAFGGDVTVDGTVTRNVVAMGGNVHINGTVDRDVQAVGGNVFLGPKAVVGGNINLLGGNLTRATGAQVGGSVVNNPRHMGTVGFPNAGNALSGFFQGLSFVLGIISAIGIVLLALLVLLFFPRQLELTGVTLEQRPLESFGLGCGGALAGAFLAFLFLITIVFSPVGLIIIGAMTIAWLLGWAAIFVITGQRLLRSANRPQELIPALLLGGLIIGILANVPGLNLAVIFFGGSLALGAAIYSRLGTRSPYPVGGPPAVPPVSNPPTTV
jgi:hypothetical protein